MSLQLPPQVLLAHPRFPLKRTLCSIIVLFSITTRGFLNGTDDLTFVTDSRSKKVGRWAPSPSFCGELVSLLTKSHMHASIRLAPGSAYGPHMLAWIKQHYHSLQVEEVAQNPWAEVAWCVGVGWGGGGVALGIRFCAGKLR